MKKVYILLYVFLLIISINLVSAIIGGPQVDLTTNDPTAECQGTYSFFQNNNTDDYVMRNVTLDADITTATIALFLNATSTNCDTVQQNVSLSLIGASYVGKFDDDPNVTMSPGEYFCILIGADGASYNRRYETTTLPISDGITNTTDYGHYVSGCYGAINAPGNTLVINVLNYQFDKVIIPQGKTATPTIVSPSPADNAHNNTQVILNVSHSTVNNDVRYYLYFADTSTLTENHLYLINVTRTGEEYRLFTTNVSTNGTYYYKWKVQNITADSETGIFSSNTTQRTWIMDTINPTISLGLNGDNNFSITNSTILSPLIHNLSIDISFFDIYLYQTLVNITNESGQSIWQRKNTSITGTTVNISESLIDIRNWSIGNYTIKLEATDSHTAKDIGEYDVEKGLDYLEYDTEEGTRIRIKSDTFTLFFKTTKYKDRYDFEFEYLFLKEYYTFRITSSDIIEYLPYSRHGFNAHFITGNNWIDFEAVGLKPTDYTIIKINDYTYDVIIKSNDNKKFNFMSLGGLNKVEEHYLIQLGAVIDIFAYDDDTSHGINVTAVYGSQSAHGKANLTAARLVNVTQDTTSITINSSGFGVETNTVSITTFFHNFSFNMTAVSALKIFFYDEKTTELISDTFSVYLERTGFTNLYTGITDNPNTIRNLGSGIYKSKISSTDYAQREFFNINMSNVSTAVLNAYLLNISDNSEIAFNVLDSNSEPIENANADFFRTLNGTSVLVAEEDTDYAGIFRLYMDTNYEYLINFTKAGFESREINLEPSISNSPYTIYLDSNVTAPPPLIDSYQIRSYADYFSNLTYINATKTVLFKWYDPNDYADNWCLYVFDSNTTYYENCSILESSNMRYIILGDNRSYTAKSIARKNDREYIVDIIPINLFRHIAELGRDILIIDWVVFITLGFLGLSNPIAALVMGVMALAGMYAMGMLPVGLSTIMGLVFVVLVIAVGIGKARKQ